MEKYFAEQFGSKTLARNFSRLDEDIFMLEENVRFYKLQADNWKKEYDALFSQQLQSGQQMIANTFLASMGLAPAVSQISPAAGIMLRTIRDMQSIEEVHAYLDEVFKKLSIELKEQE